MFTVLFVCTGNTCRSPMACGIFKKLLREKKDSSIICLSAGIACSNGEPAAPNAVCVCGEIGVDLSCHKSTNILNIDRESVNLFVVMSVAHGEFLKSLGIEQSKIYVLGGGISDPFGAGVDVYRACRDEIANAIKSVYEPVKAKGE